MTPAAFVAANTALSHAPLVPEVALHLATAITPIWQASEGFLEQSNIEPPFWAFAWPGSQALARYVLDHPQQVRGRRVLDFAAGGGLAAIACTMAGAASVEAAEIDPMAGAAIRLNAAANGRTVDPGRRSLPVGPDPVRRRLLRSANDRAHPAVAAPLGGNGHRVDRRSWPGLPATRPARFGLLRRSHHARARGHHHAPHHPAPLAPGVKRPGAWLLAALLAGCSQAALPAQAAAPPHWLAVLAAGDDSLPVFDNAVGAMAQVLRSDGAGSAEIHRFSAARRAGAQLSTRSRVLAQIAAMHPGDGQACFVFLTSHGAHGPGLYLAPRTEFIDPAALDRALASGCGDAPTVAIVSACYTGNFARMPMARPNRIILTAARADRPSFGCGAGRELTYYDGCLLQSLAAQPEGWGGLVARVRACVTRLEADDDEPASDPQSFIGRSVANLPVPGAP